MSLIVNSSEPRNPSDLCVTFSPATMYVEEGFDHIDSKRVFAAAAGIQVTNNAKCCAERRLLNLLEYEAKCAGAKGTKKRQWILRHTGGCITIWRRTMNGELANSFPCKLCRKSIQNYGLKVKCSVGPNEWFTGYLSKDNENKSKLTTGQTLFFNNKAKFPVCVHIHCGG